jgi:hypothetical protein
VHRAISYVSIVGSMRETITVTPTTSVHITVGSVKMNSSYAVHGTLFYSLFGTPIEESVGLGILGSICKRRVRLDSATFSSSRRCVVTAHLCGEPCKLWRRRGCLEDCTKVSCRDRFLERHALKPPQVMGHDDDDHMCSVLVHTCGEVWINLQWC